MFWWLIKGGIIFGGVKLIILYLCCMDKNVITIDLNKWTTQANKAAQYISKSGKPVSIQYINKLISQGKLASYRIDELNLVLVER